MEEETKDYKEEDRDKDQIWNSSTTTSSTTTSSTTTTSISNNTNHILWKNDSTKKFPV